MAWSDDVLDPGSHDQFWVMVTHCPLTKVRSMTVGSWLLCRKWVKVLGLLSRVNPMVSLSSMGLFACHLFASMLYMHVSIASSAYQRGWWQLKSPVRMLLVCLLCVLRKPFASFAVGAYMLMSSMVMCRSLNRIERIDWLWDACIVGFRSRSFCTYVAHLGWSLGRRSR